MSIKIVRSGNGLQLPSSVKTKTVLDPHLRYDHVTFYEGPTLRQRKAYKQEHPGTPFNPYRDVTSRALYVERDGNLQCPAGLLDTITGALDASNLKWTFQDMRTAGLGPPDFSKLLEIPNLEFRYKQDEVLGLMATKPGGLISAPTGYGKTMLAVFACKAWHQDRIMFLSSGLDLIRSTYYRLTQLFPSQVGRIGDGYFESKKRILLVSVDSLHKAPIQDMKLIIADEVHEMATDLRISRLCARYTDASFFGFSASLEKRADGADAALKAVFGPVLMDISYSEAVQAGVVVPIDVQFVHVPGDILTAIIDGPTVVKKRNAYWCHEHRNEVIAKAVHNSPAVIGDSDPQTLVMVSTVQHAFELKRYLPDFEVVYNGMDPRLRRKLLANGLIDTRETMNTKRRAYILREFEAGRMRKVIATQVWKKGINAVNLKVFVRADGETSSINSIQLPGRLSRVAEGKDKGLLIDCDDVFSDWTKQRARTRLKDYKALGFNILKI